MKSFAKIALLVALISIIVLSIVVASVAWFTSNPQVDANDVTLSAARTLNVAFDTAERSNFRYNGQIGNKAPGDDDAPFVYQAASFKVRVDSVSSNSMVAEIRVGFSAVNIVLPAGHVNGSIPGVLISDLFTISADVYKISSSGAYVKVIETKAQESDPTRSYFRAYNGAEDASLTRYNKVVADLSIADDGTLMDGVSPAHFEVGAYELSFTYTFLSEDAYEEWAAGNYNSVYGYERVTVGELIGVWDFVDYKAKYHYGMQRYNKSDSVDGNGNYTYEENAEGNKVMVIKEYKLPSQVTKYTSAQGAGEGAENGLYIKVGDSNRYELFYQYNRVPGFPYSDDMYMGERFEFTVTCTVEEVTNEA